jgi:hypothetical protein
VAAETGHALRDRGRRSPRGCSPLLPMSMPASLLADDGATPRGRPWRSPRGQPVCPGPFDVHPVRAWPRQAPVYRQNCSSSGRRSPRPPGRGCSSLSSCPGGRAGSA